MEPDEIALEELARLDDALLDCRVALRRARERLEAAWPVGDEVIVRTQRFGFEAKEWRGRICAAGLEMGGTGFDVRLRIRNLKTGKMSSRYPGLKVAGVSQVRLAALG